MISVHYVVSMFVHGKDQLQKVQKNLHSIEILNELKTDAEHIAETNDVKHQRDHFASLSENLYTLAKSATNGNTIYYQKCPMYNNGKGAFWLSQENTIKNQLAIYPNPATGPVTIEMGVAGDYNLILMDPRGSKILSKEFNGSTTLDMKDQATGTYILQVISKATGEKFNRLIKRQNTESTLLKERVLFQFSVNFVLNYFSPPKIIPNFTELKKDT